MLRVSCVKAAASPNRRYLHPRLGRVITTVLPGEYYVTESLDEGVSTILGSCVSACIRDPITRLGGLNHFLLPGEELSSGLLRASDSARYGSVAMERLINHLLARGARRDRLEVKVAGGASIDGSNTVGQRNADFVLRFLAADGFRVSGRDLGGSHPRRIYYFPSDGKVLIQKLESLHDEKRVRSRESRYRQSLDAAPVAGGIELFT